MSLQSELLKIQVNIEAEEVKAKETEDFCRGFDYACQLLSDYFRELTLIYYKKVCQEVIEGES